MENLFKELAWKCLENGLHFDVSPNLNGETDSLRVFTFDENDESFWISEGITRGWHTEYEAPAAALTRMHQEVDEFIENETKEDTEFINQEVTNND